MKKFSALLLVIVMALSLAGCNSTNIQGKMGSGDKVLATSGSEKIYLRDYLYLLGSYKAQTEYYFSYYYGLAESEINEYWQTESTSGTGLMYDDLKSDILASVEESAILYKLAMENGFTFDQAELDEVKASIDNAVVNMASPDKTGERYFYDVYLVTPEEALEATKRFGIVEAYQESIYNSVEVTDEEVRAFYDNEANHDTVEDARNVTVAHILIGFPTDESGYALDITDEEKAEYEAKAHEILSRIATGEDFGVLAAEYSTDPGSKDNNGEYTINRTESFVQEFMDWTFSAQVGDYGIVETSYGYHIMNLVSVEGFDEMKDTLKAAVIDNNYYEIMSSIIFANQMQWELNQDLYDSIVYVPYEVSEETE